ncbi:LolA family protein [Pseudarthrobacter sp. O4]|uniref:LolA family protein n=1 Tax=Pseudarthrobacter sp. O4 TaxID=3418417 RepID=UPI003CE692B0
MTGKWLRWIPAVAVPAVIAGGVLVGSLPASAGDPLPAKTPQQVLLMIAQHQEKSLSGTLEQSSEIGLPQLPKAGPGAGSPDTAWLELLTGPHTARVYLDGPENARVQVMDRMAERNAIKHGNELWFYNSKDNTAAHAQLPAGTAEHHRTGPGTMRTPAELADTLLAKLDETTDVKVGPDVRVAGRPAYNLVLTPKSTVTLMGSIAISVDGESGLPLGVELKARGQSEPAFRVAFTNLSLETPDASVFEFSPPPGATVKEIPVPEHTSEGPMARPDKAHEPKGATRPAVTGTGWESVIELPAGALAAPATPAGPPSPDRGLSGGSSSGAAALLEQAATPVPGGRLVSTALVNVLILDDGRVFAGAVPLERLQSAAKG